MIQPLLCSRQSAPLLAALFFFALGPALAATTGANSPDVQGGDKQGQLSDLRSRISALSTELAKAEESRSEATDQLREGEIAISVANRRLHELAEERHEVGRELAKLDTQIKSLDKSTTREQHQLALLLNRQFVGGDSDALSLLLAGKDPNQAARDRYFLTRLSLAKAELARELKTVAAQKRELRAQISQREEALRDIEAAQQAGHAQLLKEQKQRETLLQKIAGKIKSQRKEIGALKRDEQRLTNLIAGLSRIGARSKASSTTSSHPQSGSPRKGSGKARNAQVGSGRTAPLADNDPGRVAGTFGSLRGRLPMPVSGVITGRFGSRRLDDSSGTGVWKGLFVQADAGTEVHTVAAGTIVFADWLRGFGNLLIVDHGDDFLSIYAFNESLLKQVGQKTAAGESVATVGNSGGSAHSGLYFELRHQGQAFDPLKWMRR